MTHRIVTDRLGIEWDVWEVFPSAIERRRAQSSAFQPERRTGKRRDLRILVTENLQRGWLAFQSAGEKRRLAPVPVDWLAIDDEDVLALLEQAEPVGTTG